MESKRKQDNKNKQMPAWAKTQLRIHLKQKQLDASQDEQIYLLKKRKRSRWWMLVVNVAAILFFGYSFYFGITQLSDTLLYILLAVFVINVILIFYQTKQLNRLVAYLEE